MPHISFHKANLKMTFKETFLKSPGPPNNLFFQGTPTNENLSLMYNSKSIEL